MNNCGCNYKKYCKSCSYTNPNKVPSEYYDYWNETWWNNWNTTNGWGATKGETQQGLSTGDNLSGYGLSTGGRGMGQNQKLKMSYEYNGKFYLNPSQLVFVNNEWIPVANIPNVKKKCIIVTV